MTRNQALDVLCTAYLGEDLFADYTSWEQAVDDFALMDSTQVPAAIEAAEAVLRESADDAAVARALDKAGSAYNAEFFGQTYTEWLRAVIERLRIAALSPFDP